MKKRLPLPINLLLWLLGVLLSIGSPLIATLSFFPLWVAKGGEVMVSGFTLLLLLLCALPIYRLIKKGISSPSGITLWLILFLLFFALSRIAEQMTVISLVGLIGNLCGGALFKLRERLSEGDRDEG